MEDYMKSKKDKMMPKMMVDKKMAAEVKKPAAKAAKKKPKK
jgi:hypothetical protein